MTNSVSMVSDSSYRQTNGQCVHMLADGWQHEYFIWPLTYDSTTLLAEWHDSYTDGCPQDVT